MNFEAAARDEDNFEAPAGDEDAVGTETAQQASTNLKPLAPKDAHALISRVQVTTDSVVATLRVTTAKDIDQLDVLWGDGGRDSQTHPGGFWFGQQQPPGADEHTLPQGTYTFYHRYSDGNGDPFQQDIYVYARLRSEEEDDVLAPSRSDSVHRRLTLTPLYTVSMFPASVRLTNYADLPPHEKILRFRVTQKVDEPDDLGIDLHEWPWPASNYGFPNAVAYVLEGSQVTKHRMKANEEVNLYYIFVRLVSFWFDSPPGMASTHIGPRTEQGWVDTPALGLPIRVRYLVETQLHVPLPPEPGPPVFA